LPGLGFAAYSPHILCDFGRQGNVTAQWEYQATMITTDDQDELNQHLNAMATEGWELVHANMSVTAYARTLGFEESPHYYYAQYWRRPAQ
jgi:hypothetical protein